MAAVSVDAEREIKEAIEKAKSGALSTFLTVLIQILKRHNLAWEQRKSSLLIGVHPSNRDGQGIHSSHVAKLCTEFFELEWNGDLQKPFCTEVSPRHTSVQDYNERFWDVLRGRSNGAENMF